MAHKNLEQQDKRHQHKVASTANNTVQQQYGLPDVVQEVPHLLNMVHRRSWAALSGSNTQLRQAIHSCTTAVLIKDQNHLQTLFGGYWPQLAIVILRKQHLDWKLSWPPSNTLQLIAVLDLWQSRPIDSVLDLLHDKSKCSVLLVAPKAQQQQASVTCYCTSATAASAFLSSRCVDVGQVRSRQRQVVAQLASLNWGSLTHLDLSNIKLEAADMTFLKYASFTQLFILSLSWNNLGSNGIEMLIAAKFPQLVYLDLGQAQLDAAAAEALVKGDWPSLKILDLFCNLLDDAAMVHIANGNWPELMELRLFNNPIGALGFQRLTKGRWPKLESLMVVTTMLSVASLKLLDIHTLPCAPTPDKWRDWPMEVPRDFANHDSDQPLIWPSLACISCWPPQKTLASCMMQFPQ